MTDLTITPGSTVLIAGFDDIPAHQFLVEEALKDCKQHDAARGDGKVSHPRPSAAEGQATAGPG